MQRHLQFAWQAVIPAAVAEFARAADAADTTRYSGSDDATELAREDAAAEASAESEGMPPEV